MTQAEFSNLAGQLIAANEANPFGPEFLDLHNRFNAELDQLMGDAQLVALEAAYEASEDYRHLAHNNF